MGGLAGHREAIALGRGALRGRQRLDVAREDRRVGLDFLDRNLPGDEGIEIAGVKQGEFRQRTRGDVPVLVVGAGIGLMGGVEARQRFAIGRGERHGADGAVLDQVQDSVVKVFIGVMGHAPEQNTNAARRKG